MAYSLRPAPVKAIVAAALANIGIWIFNSTISMAIEATPANSIGPNPVTANVFAGLAPLHLAAFILAAVVIASFSEEVFFRGMMQNVYSRCGERQAFVLASLLFGLCHALSDVTAVIPATLLDFALGYSALKTGSIWPGIALHAANNGIASLIQTSALNPISVLGWWPGIARLEFGIPMIRIIKSSGASRENRKPPTHRNPPQYSALVRFGVNSYYSAPCPLARFHAAQSSDRIHQTSFKPVRCKSHPCLHRRCPGRAKEPPWPSALPRTSSQKTLTDLH